MKQQKIYTSTWRHSTQSTNLILLFSRLSLPTLFNRNAAVYALALSHHIQSSLAHTHTCTSLIRQHSVHCLVYSVVLFTCLCVHFWPLMRLFEFCIHNTRESALLQALSLALVFHTVDVSMVCNCVDEPKQWANEPLLGGIQPWAAETIVLLTWKLLCCLMKPFPQDTAFILLFLFFTPN